MNIESSIKPNNTNNGRMSAFRLSVSRVGIPVFIFLFSIVAVILLYIDDNQSGDYSLIYLLPLSYGAVNILFFGLHQRHQNIAITAIVALEGFRMVVTPLVMMQGNYYSAMTNISKDQIDRAVFLMIYELVTVYICLALTLPKKDKGISLAEKKKPAGAWVNKALLIMVVFLLFVVLVYPNAIAPFKSILDMSSDSFTDWELTQDRFETGTIARILGTLFSLVFSWARYLIPVAVIIWCKKHIKISLFAILISFIPIILQMLFITSTIMDSILCAFISFLVLARCYPKKQKGLFAFAAVSAALVIFLYFYFSYVVRRGGTIGMWEFISENAVAYVGGLPNVAAMMNVAPQYKADTLFFNIYGAIPFNSTLFGLSGDKLAAVFNAANGRADGHIPPTIGASWYYFGALLAPIESIIYTRLAVRFGYRAARKKSLWRYMAAVLCSLMFVMAFTTYNSAIVLNYCTTLLLPLLIVCKYSENTEI